MQSEAKQETMSLNFRSEILIHFTSSVLSLDIGISLIVPAVYLVKTLTNSYYYGYFRFAGEIYEGRYDPIVSKQLFDKVQEVLNSKNKQWKYANIERIQKPFLGLLRCGECGMMITAENKTKRYKNGGFSEYHYYRCTKKNKTIKCSQPFSTTEKSIDSQLTTLLKKYALRCDWANQMLLKLKQEESDISQSSLSLISQKRNEIDNLNTKLKVLLDTYLDQEVDKEIYSNVKYPFFCTKFLHVLS